MARELQRNTNSEKTHSLLPRLPRLLGLLWGTTNRQDILLAARFILKQGSLVQGPAIAGYEQEFARRVGVRHAVSFSSGRLALYGLLRTLGISTGDEVLLQVPTHIVVANAIRYVGAKPVFVDCDLATYNMDLDLAEEQITPRSRVLLLQHTFGIPAEPDKALDIARRHNLILIEDCVHALGGVYQGKSLGSFGRAAFFSTEETKIISSTMGGMAVTDDDALAASLRRFQASLRLAFSQTGICVPAEINRLPLCRSSLPASLLPAALSAHAEKSPPAPGAGSDLVRGNARRPGNRPAAGELPAAHEQCPGGGSAEPAAPAGFKPGSPPGDRRTIPGTADPAGIPRPLPSGWLAALLCPLPDLGRRPA